MSKLSAAARKALPASVFAGPDRSSPILKAKIDAKANRKLAHPSGDCAFHGK